MTDEAFSGVATISVAKTGKLLYIVLIIIVHSEIKFEFCLLVTPLDNR